MQTSDVKQTITLLKDQLSHKAVKKLQFQTLELWITSVKVLS